MRAGDRLPLAVDVRPQVLQLGAAGPSRELTSVRPAKWTSGSITLPGRTSSPCGHVLEPQLVEGGVLRQRRALQVEQVLNVQVQLDQHVARGHQALAVDEGRGRELAHHRRRHQRPGLHEEARLDRPAAAVQREVDDGVAVLQGPVGGVEQRGLASGSGSGRQKVVSEIIDGLPS